MPERIIEKQTSCNDSREPDILSVDAARKNIFEQITPLQNSEKLPVKDTLNRVLADDISSSINVPGHNNSAMDGYAISGDAIPQTGTKTFTVIGTAYAGKMFSEKCQHDQCIRIMTGSVMPEGTDSVIMQEHVHRAGNNITIDSSHTTGQNVRLAGEDIAIGTVVLSKGKLLTPADIGIISSLGIGELNVIRRPRVAFFSTGDELRSIGDGSNRPLSSGEIYDSNRYSLYAMLQQLNVDIIDMGVVRDDETSIRKALVEASSMADIIITSGGVSVGEADFIKPVLEDIGQINFWKIAMKPGRPLTFGQLDNSLFFGLPGNPVSVMVTFYQFVQPAIRYLASGKIQLPLNLKAICSTKLRKRSGRFEFQRGILSHTSDGLLTVDKTGQQGSGVLTSMSLANCFILLDEVNAGVEPGETVTVQPFDSII
ncbi:MAG: molybdopterin molybdotransferase MoeA [Gammaproteobacteria bacterium]|nr:molybdopterin molybdotransferase MoeA [Gammaproteobacteria bacterium]